MPRPVLIVTGLAMIVSTFLVAGWMMRRSMRMSDDPARLLFKWVLTGLVAAFLIFIGLGLGPDKTEFVVVPFAAVVAGIMLSFIWAPSIGALLAKPFTSLFDGGGQEPEAKPLYSTA